MKKSLTVALVLFAGIAQGRTRDLKVECEYLGQQYYANTFVAFGTARVMAPTGAVSANLGVLAASPRTVFNFAEQFEGRATRFLPGELMKGEAFSLVLMNSKDKQVMLSLFLHPSSNMVASSRLYIANGQVFYSTCKFRE